MKLRVRIGSALLLATVIGTEAGLAAWKYASLQEANVASANLPEPMESVTVAVATEREHRRTTSIGTVIALRSITLRNELPGTVRQVMLTPGQVVDAGALYAQLAVQKLPCGSGAMEGRGKSGENYEIHLPCIP